MKNHHVVTGAFGYSGSHIARALLAAGNRVGTLSGKLGRGHDLEGAVKRAPLDFEDPAALTRSLRGARVLYNTYWVRFSKGGFHIADGVRNSALLFECARAAGVERVVHVSITKPSKSSPYEYFRGKAEVESALVASGLAHTILRPALLFGGDDILINNIAWALRKLPVFGVFGDGEYPVQPIHVEDLAQLAVEAGSGQLDRPNEVIDAVGPEVMTYRELVRKTRDAMGLRRGVLGMPRTVGLCASRVLGFLQRDVTLTREEVGALMDGLLIGEGPATGTRRLSTWLRDEASALGRSYHSELVRR